jgi:transcriptional regulator GlxA family with amidase domain
VACEFFGVERPALGAPWYRFVLCSADPPPVSTIIPGLTLTVPRGLGALRQADTIIVLPCAQVETPSPVLLTALRSAHRRGARLVSLCTGAFVLAAAGLLDGRVATTHWNHTDDLARLHPEVTVDPRVLYVDDGDILTSAGSAASIDLCLHVVRSDFGAEVANQVARSVVVPPHRDGGQAQFVMQPVPDPVTDNLFSDTLEWVGSHLHEELSVQLLAQRSAVSPRTFARQFRAVTGTTPMQWILRQRVMLAQRLLETTDLSVDMLAESCGLGSAANLRQQFHRAVGTSPSAYRRTFRAAG